MRCKFKRNSCMFDKLYDRAQWDNDFCYGIWCPVYINLFVNRMLFPRLLTTNEWVWVVIDFRPHIVPCIHIISGTACRYLTRRPYPPSTEGGGGRRCYHPLIYPPPWYFFTWHSKTLFFYAKWFLKAVRASFAVILIPKWDLPRG